MITNFSIKNSIPFKQLDLPLSDLTVITGHNKTNIDNITDLLCTTITLFECGVTNKVLFNKNDVLNLQLEIDGINNIVNLNKTELNSTVYDFIENKKNIINFNYNYIDIIGMFRYPLNQYEKLPVLINSLLHPNALSNSLIDQINEWVSELIEPLQLENTNGDYIIPPYELSIATYRLINVVYNVLISKPNDVIIIEYPEASLHPSVQSKLMKLLTLAAQNGIQIIMITQSDHIINSILLACKRFEKDNKIGIDKEKVKILYLDKEESEIVVHDIKVKEKGKIKNPPNGFFDQIGKDIREFHDI